MTTTTSAKKATPATKAAGTKAPAKVAGTKAPAKKAAPTPADRKLRWQVDGGDRSMAGKVGQTATVDGHEYKIAGKDKAWKATVKVGGKTTVLAEGSFGKAYTACVKHNRER